MLVYQRVSHFLPHRSARLRWALPGGPRASEVVWRGPSRTKTPMLSDSEPICCWGISNIDIHHSCMCIYVYIYMYTYMLIPNKKELGHIFNQCSISGYISSESTFWIPRTTQQVARAKWSLSLCSCHWRTWRVVRYGEMGNVCWKKEHLLPRKIEE